jgi:hypothetical protein
VDINGAILEVIALTRGEVVKNGISVQSHLVEGLPLIQGDRVQVQQVIMNLIVNAIEALSSICESSRELVITTAKGEPDGVLVEVRDSGPGLRSLDLERVFDTPSLQQSPAAWGWVYRSAAPSLKRTGDDYGPPPPNLRARLFNSPCLHSQIRQRDLNILQWAMCGRLRVGKENLHFTVLVGAAMCPACLRGAHDRWP